MYLTEQITTLMTEAEQESQTDWDAYAKYKRLLNDIPLDSGTYTQITRQLAEIFDL